MKLKNNPNDPCKTTYALHKRRVEAYKEIKQHYIRKSQEAGSTVLLLEFDYAQNLPLPKLSVTSQFYKRLLWMFLFNIHCHNDGTSTFYYFLETEGKKDPSSVCSFLHDFLLYKIKEETFKPTEIVLLSDAAGGQNKNSVVVAYCSWVAMTFNVPVFHIFPVRGHSYNQCDRNFGLYSKTLKKIENVYTASQYIEVFKKCRQNPFPFKVEDGSNIIKNWSDCLRAVFGKIKPRAKSVTFKIQSYPRLMYTTSGAVLASTHTRVLIILSNMRRNDVFLRYYHYHHVQLLALNQQKKKIFEVCFTS